MHYSIKLNLNFKKDCFETPFNDELLSLLFVTTSNNCDR